MTTSIAISMGERAFLFAGDRVPFFDTLALLDWRHSTDVLTNVRAVRDSQASEPEIERFRKTDDFAFLTSMAAEIDFLASTATGTLIATSIWRQSTSVDAYLELFRSAGQGEALNTPFQVQLFLDHLGVDATLCIIGKTQRSGATANVAIVDGGHRQFVLRNIQDFWLEISNTLEGNKPFTSAFEIQNYVQKNFVAWVQVRARTLVLFSLPVPKFAPSTHDWVHSFVLWTGISPPAEVSESDVIDVRCAQKPRAKGNYRDFLCRQKDRTGGARTRRSRSSQKNCGKRCSQNRYFVGRRKVGRGAFRRSWANCQDAWYQAA
jgi:hypothetical protein